MDFFDLVKYRRSVRKYQSRQIERTALDRIIEAGLYAPSAGGGQKTMIVAIRNKEICEKIGKLNAAKLDRSRLEGSYVSDEQPSLIDNPNIKNGFYGAPAVCVIFGAKNFLYSIPDAFCCAENMVLAASELGIASCIVARGEETFNGQWGSSVLAKWKVSEDYIARCFVILGYCDGKYPKAKSRKAGRSLIVE